MPYQQKLHEGFFLVLMKLNFTLMKGDKGIKLFKHFCYMLLFFHGWKLACYSNKRIPIQSLSKIGNAVRQIVNLIDSVFSSEKIIHKRRIDFFAWNGRNVGGAYHSFTFSYSNCALPRTHHIENQVPGIDMLIGRFICTTMDNFSKIFCV